MDPLRLCIALGPLAAYTLILGLINLSSRPFLTTGGRDIGALGVAVIGFMMVGPAELFLPAMAVQRFGPYVWLLALGLYCLVVTLCVLTAKPRMIIYNISADQIRPILANLVTELDPNARWAGDSLMLPHLGIQLHVESSSALRNTQLIANGRQQSYDGWDRLAQALAPAIKEAPAVRNPYGFSLVLASAITVSVLAFLVVTEHQAVAQSLLDLLRM